MSEIVKVEYSISTDKVGSECVEIAEFEKDYWESLTPNQKAEEMKEYAFEHVEWFYRVLD